MERLRALVDGHAGEQTLLIVDASAGEETLKLFKNCSQFAVLDAKILHTKRVSRHQHLDSILEEGRNVLAYAVTRGKVLVVRLGDAPVDFRATYCDECCPDLETKSHVPPFEEQKYLPKGFMLKGGAFVRHPPSALALLRRDDLRDISAGFAVTQHPNFKVVVCTTIPEDRLDDMLFNGAHGLPGERGDYAVTHFS